MATSSASVLSTVSVGIVGAGISGAICARTLKRAGITVQVFEKSHGPGGRMATRRRAEPYRFDHGAQYFTLQNHPTVLEELKHTGTIALWPPRFTHWKAGKITADHAAVLEPHFVGTPAMSSICARLLDEIPVHYDHTVASVKWDGAGGHREEQGKWIPSSTQTAGFNLSNNDNGIIDKSEGSYGTNGTGVSKEDTRDDDGRMQGRWKINMLNGQSATVNVLLFTMPAPQLQRLIPSWVPFSTHVTQVTYSPCWTMMLGYKSHLPVNHDVVNFVGHRVLGRAIRDSAKPKRNSSLDSWVVQANESWSLDHLEDDNSHVEKIMLQHVRDTLDDMQPSHVAVHRWRYAFAHCLGVDSFWNADARVGACGDWCLGSSVEQALDSGVTLAQKVIKHFSG